MKDFSQWRIKSSFVAASSTIRFSSISQWINTRSSFRVCWAPTPSTARRVTELKIQKKHFLISVYFRLPRSCMLSSLSSPSTISMFSAVEDLQDDSLAPLLTHHAAFEETVSVRVIHSDSECQKSKRKYWATCSSARSLVRSHHWYACYALLASLARSLARSLTRSGRTFLCNFQGDLSHCVIVYLLQYLCPYRCCYGGTFEYV